MDKFIYFLVADFDKLEAAKDHLDNMQKKILEERLFNLSERMKSAKNIKHSGVRAMKVKQIRKEVAATRRQLNKLKEVSYSV